jgi:branched-chain amino acid transport system substrate-binding protein
MKTAQFTRRAICVAIAATCSIAFAQKKYDDGASDKEVVVGNIAPYSGPASAYGTFAKATAAYFDKINAEGGINGRKIRYISLDDGYNPAKTIEQARKLVEQEKVLFLAGTLGTSPNNAIHLYLNQKKVPMLLVGSGATKWDDPKNFPWTMGWVPLLEAEGKTYAKHILETRPNAKIAVLYQNDDYGRDYLKGLKAGLGARAKDMIVAEGGVEQTDPTVDSQVVTLKASGADTIMYFAPIKISAQGIKKVGELGWKPVQYISNGATSVDSVMKPGGLDNAKGIISQAYMKEPSDPAWKGTPEYEEWAAWMKKYYPAGSLSDMLNVYGYCQGQVAAQIIRQAGDNLTRENIMKQAASLNMKLPMLLPGSEVRTSPTDLMPISAVQLQSFDGSKWVLVPGKVYPQ